jgi:ADP-ribose pyrophosphatase YjhB (NUDIX family)
MSEQAVRKFVKVFKVHAVIIRDDEILATFHDNAFGGFLGLPADYVSSDESPRATVERAVLEQTSLEVAAGGLLAIDHLIFNWYRFKQYERTEIRTEMAFLCTLKQDGTPRVSDDAYFGSILKVDWVKLSDFVDDLPSPAREFWKRAIRVLQGEEPVDLVEHPPHDIYI